MYDFYSFGLDFCSHRSALIRINPKYKVMDIVVRQERFWR
ncbi:hypothetical protein SPHINGO391_510077 [Sphingomonas aurantiaca]|uniref:Uncharacterized protein n=1 Tax=Sphingomonas aurantiaca TaxID=185949 RepID=A0A5E8AE40_9SPHN|nr:hypothetical protein SPHINGO391_510077 [Sphingomonas aurantiaca]